MEFTKEEKALETLKEVASDDFDTLGDDISPKMAQNILNFIKKQQKEIEDNKKFKKDIVGKIMIWDKEELPDNKSIIEMIDTLMSEVSRLEDIEDKKIEVAVDFIEEKRDKFWKDKIREKLNQINNEYSILLSNKSLRLELQNMNTQRHEAMRVVLEELLEEK